MGATLSGFDARRIPRGYYIISAIGTAFGVTVLLKDKYGGKKYESEEQITGKTVIVTGANTGIGKEIARGLAKRGGRIIMACRNMEKCEKARKDVMEHAVLPDVECRELDLSSFKSIRKFVKSIKDEKRVVDVLINNAAVMCCPKTLTDEGFEWQFGVNYLGHFLLTNLLLDNLKASSNGRVISLVSPIFKKGQIYFEDLNSAKDYFPKDAYAQSKLALVFYTQELARRLKGTKVTVNCVNPGVTKTEIGRHLPMGKAAISGSMWSPILWVFMKNAYQASQTPIFLATDSSIKDITGQYFSDLQMEPLPENCTDKEIALRLWRISEKWTGLDTS